MNHRFLRRRLAEPFDLTYRQQVKCTELALALGKLFAWSESPEGYRYWEEVCDRLRAHGVSIH